MTQKALSWHLSIKEILIEILLETSLKQEYRQLIKFKGGHNSANMLHYMKLFRQYCPKGIRRNEKNGMKRNQSS